MGTAAADARAGGLRYKHQGANAPSCIMRHTQADMDMEHGPRAPQSDVPRSRQRRARDRVRPRAQGPPAPRPPPWTTPPRSGSAHAVWAVSMTATPRAMRQRPPPPQAPHGRHRRCGGGAGAVVVTPPPAAAVADVVAAVISRICTCGTRGDAVMRCGGEEMSAGSGRERRRGAHARAAGQGTMLGLGRAEEVGAGVVSVMLGLGERVPGRRSAHVWGGWASTRKHQRDGAPERRRAQDVDEKGRLPSPLFSAPPPGRAPAC